MTTRSAHLRRSLRFGSITIEYDDRVLAPRPWTQMQSRWAVELALTAPVGQLLELCTGAGHIGLLAAALTRRTLVAVDADPAACYFARLNAEGAGLSHRVEVRESSCRSALRDGERFALAIADPPWVCSWEVSRFPEDPTSAIDGGPDGLDLAMECLDTCRDRLLPGGSLLLQLGSRRQVEELASTAAERGWDRGPVREEKGHGVVWQVLPRP